MKALFILALSFTLFNFFSLNAQQEAPPQGINYQAVAVDNSGKETVGTDVTGKPIAEKEIRVRFSIIKTSETGTLEYREVHLVTTDAYGLFNTVIGQGIEDASPNSFDQIDWGTGYHFLKVEMDITGGTDYKDMGTKKLWSVPYSLYSKYSQTSGNGIDSVTDNGDGTLTFTYIDGSTYTTPVLTGLTGAQGPAGTPGQNGLSAYEIWLAEGNTGTESDFLNSITGPQGPQGIAGDSGIDGLNSLVKTTPEPSGANCANGGVKIESGLDLNGNNILDPSEIDITQTVYVCSPALQSQGGNTNYYTVNTLHNGFAGSIQAQGYYAATTTTITQEFTDLNAKEFQFIMIEASHKCFSVGANFTFFDSLNNQLSAMYDDRRTWQTYNSSWDWTTQPVERNFGSTSSLMIPSTIDNSAGGQTMRVIERAVRIVPSGVVDRVVVTFNTANVFTTSCLNCNCKDSYFSPGPNPYSGFVGNVSYKLFSFE